MEYHVYWVLKSSCFKIFGDGKYGLFFEPKSWWKYIYWLLKSSCFELFTDEKYGNFLRQKVDGKMIDIYWLLKSFYFKVFGDGKYGLFLSQSVDGKMIFTDYWNVLVLNFPQMGNTVFFSVKKLMETRYLLSLFELSMIFQDLGNMVFLAVFSLWCWKTKRISEQNMDYRLSNVCKIFSFEKDWTISYVFCVSCHIRVLLKVKWFYRLIVRQLLQNVIN